MVVVMLLLALYVFSVALISAGQGSVADVAVRLNEQNHARLVRTLAEHVDQYLFEFGELPSNEIVLRAQPGYEQLANVRKDNIRLSYVPTVSGSSYDFNRFIISSPYRYYSGTHEDLIDQNECGLNRAAPDYCLTNMAFWATVEDRSILSYRKTLAAQQADNLFKKLGVANAAGSVARETASGAELAEGEVIMLANAVGYTGSADACEGVFHFSGVALTCRDIFDLYGNDIAYTYLGNNGYAVVITLDPLTTTGESENIIKAGFL